MTRSLTVGVAIIILLGAMWLFFRLFDKLSGVSERRRLLEVGLPGSAQILSIKRGGETWTVGGRRYPQIVMEVVVYPPKGPKYESALSAYISEESIPRIQPGANVPVRINPENPDNLALDAEYSLVR